jgi:hypothetical protein
MATYSTDLFDLIKALTIAEKAYFKKYAYKQQTDSKDNPYLRLFDAIDKQELYDEEKLIHKLAKEKITKQFSAAKNYLYNLILDCIAMYDATEGNTRHKLRQQIRQVEVLVDRGLREQAAKKAEAARKLLHPDNIINQYSLHIELINLSLEILPYKAETFDERMKLQYEKEHVFTVVSNSQQYYNLYLKTIYLLYKTGDKQLGKHQQYAQEFKEIIEHPLMDNISLALSFNARLFFCNIWFDYYMWIADYTKALQYAQLQLAQFNTLSLRLGNVQKYMVAYKGVLMALTQLNDVANFEKTVQEITNWYEEYGDRVQPESIETILGCIYGSPFDAYYKWKKYAKALALIPRMKIYFADPFAQRQIPAMMHYQFCIAALYFYMGNYDAALNELNVLLDNKNLETLPAYHGYARILHLLIHFELDNDLLLESLGRATYRFLHQHQSDYQVEMHLVRFMRNVSQIPNKRQMIIALQNLRDKLTPLQNEDFEKEAFEVIHYLDWIDSKLANCSMVEWTERQATKILN